MAFPQVAENFNVEATDTQTHDVLMLTGNATITVPSGNNVLANVLNSASTTHLVIFKYALTPGLTRSEVARSGSVPLSGTAPHW